MSMGDDEEEEGDGEDPAPVHWRQFSPRTPAVRKNAHTATRRIGKELNMLK
jgi:hypothetical protein